MKLADVPQITKNLFSKSANLLTNPVDLLSEFGKNIADPNQERILEQAEEYLVKVLKLTTCTSCKTMDELHTYHQSKMSDIDQFTTNKLIEVMRLMDIYAGSL